MKQKTSKVALHLLFAISWLARPFLAHSALAGNLSPPFTGLIKVFILAGQSNMKVHADVQALDRLSVRLRYGDQLKKIKKPDETFVARDNVLVHYQTEDEELTRPLSLENDADGEGSLGPELMFGIEKSEPLLTSKP
jgi:hypothetical protein